MDLNAQKEQFSRAFAGAVVSAAGFKYSPGAEPDDDSVDMTLSATGTVGAWFSPRIDVQLKCTADLDSNDEVWKFPLRMKNYNDLRAANCHVPRILVVLCVPEDPSEWVVSAADSSILRNGARWVSLRGRLESDNSASVTVELNAASGFHVDGVRELFRMVGEEQL